MRLFRRPVSLILSLILIFGMMAAVPVSGGAEDDPIISNSFEAQHTEGSASGELVYYYSDSYFRTSGKIVNPHLMTMSGVMMYTISGVSGTPEETYGSILREIGFGDIVTYDMDHTALDSIGVVLAHKQIDGKDVVAVMLRGDGYGVEMAANFIAGAQGDIEAFADAEALVENRVSAYLDEFGITAAKYWVVGYSRSGAVANLFGRELNRAHDRFRTVEDDIYVYTIEAALSSGDDTAYENIHNIIDRRDAVTYLYPAAWSVYHNGVPAYIGDGDETIMIRKFDTATFVGVKDMTEVNAADFLQDFVDFISTIVSRETYAEKLQTTVSELLTIYFGLSKAEQDELLAFFEQVAAGVMEDSNLPAVFINAILGPTYDKNINRVAVLVTNNMDMVSEENGQPLDDDSYEKLKASIRPIAEVFLPVFSEDYQCRFDSGDGTGSVYAPLYHLVTFFTNIDILFKHHHNNSIFNALTALDSYYHQEQGTEKPAEKSRVIGDADGSGDVNILDATVIQRYLAAMTTRKFIEENADADENGEVTILDATAIQRYLVGFNSLDRIGTTI